MLQKVIRCDTCNVYAHFDFTAEANECPYCYSDKVAFVDVVIFRESYNYDGEVGYDESNGCE
jgi:hypothetical protein